jgi:cytochrome b561
MDGMGWQAVLTILTAGDHSMMCSFDPAVQTRQSLGMDIAVGGSDICGRKGFRDISDEAHVDQRQEDDMRDTGAGEMKTYGGVAKAFHWLIVVLLVAQFIVAWTMPEIHRGTKPDTLILLHLSLGGLILLSAILRLAWRISHPVEALVDPAHPWEARVAQATHVLLYLLLLVMPVLGWANASARGWSVDLFGVVTLPELLPEGDAFGRQLGDVHVLAAYALLALVGLHAAAALFHHFVRKDQVLSRMLFGQGADK